MTKSHAALVAHVERSQRIGDITRADALALCALVRQQDAALALIAAYGRDTALPCAECGGQESHDRESCPFAWAEGARR